MNSDKVRPVKRRPYWSFIALLYSLLGWVLFDAWLFLMGAGFLSHIFAAIPGAALVIRSAFRPSIDRSNAADQEKNSLTESRRAATSCALLYVLGVIFGSLVLNGSLTLLGVIAVSFTFTPWARLSFSRDRLAISCVSTMSGFASVIAIGHGSINTMFLPLAAWAFWSCACCALLLRAEQLRRTRHETNVTTKAVETEARAIHSPG
jgi:hypothetical protein